MRSTTSDAVERWRALGVELAFDPAAPGVPADDLAHLDAAQLARCFPRDDDGRLPLDAVVLLAPIAGAIDPPRPPKQRWLLAESPSRRSAPQVLTLALRDENGRNFEHRWDEARWLWDARAAATTTELVRWGTTWQLVEQAAAAGGDSAPARAARALHLVRAGRWRDALALCGVTHALDELPYRRCNHGRGISPALWDRALEHGMRDVAPWRFAGLVHTKTEQRLFNFPGQTTARKYCVVLRDDGGGTPHLAVGLTGANTRVPAVRWRWPPDLALRVNGEHALPLTSAPPHTTARTASESELLAQIAADPTADDARRVLADLLSERGDSRGELIVLQLLPARDAKAERRMRAIVRAHWREWLGPLGRLAERVEFERGFPVRCTLGSEHTPFDAWSSATTPRARAELAGVRELELSDNFPPDVAADVLAFTPSLRQLAIAPALLPLIRRPLAVLELRIADATTLPAALAALVTHPPHELRLSFTELHSSFIGTTRDCLRLADAVPLATHRYVIGGPQLSLTLARQPAGALTGFDVTTRSRRHIGHVLPSVVRACERAWLDRIVVHGEAPPPWAQAAIAQACSPLGIVPRYGA